MKVYLLMLLLGTLAAFAHMSSAAQEQTESGPRLG